MKGGKSIKFPAPPGLPPELLEQVRIQNSLMRALMPSEEDIAAQRGLMQRTSAYLSQFEPFLTPEEIKKREGEQTDYLMNILQEGRQEQIRQAIERGNRYGLNPALTIGQIERGAQQQGMAIRSGDALQRAMALTQMGESARQNQLQGLGLTSQLAWSPYARTIGPAQQSTGALSNFLTNQYNQQFQLAMAQAQLAQAGAGRGLGGLSSVGSLVGAGIGGAVGGLPGATLGMGIGGAAGGAAGYPWSSRRFKKDIQLADERKSLHDVLSADVVTFKYKVGDDDEKTGIIAEDAPEAFVTKDRMAMDLGKSTGTLIAALQAEHDELESLKSEVSDLREQVNA